MLGMENLHIKYSYYFSTSIVDNYLCVNRDTRKTSQSMNIIICVQYSLEHVMFMFTFPVYVKCRQELF